MKKKKCDHKSVGIITKRNNKLLLIERKLFPFGFAPPAGHVDQDKTYEEAAKRELFEEVGLVAQGLKLVIQGKKNNKCRREGGNWHFWKIFEVDTKGKVKPSLKETKQVGWFSRKKIAVLVKRTEDYLKGKISEKNWEKSPGIEPVWYEWFKDLKIV